MPVESVPPEFIFKILLIGENAVGKTSLIIRYVEDRFSDDYQITLGCNFLFKQLELPWGKIKVKVSLQIWDIAGASRYASFRKLYYGGTHGIMMVCDLTRPSTLQNLEQWKNDAEKHAQNIPIVLICNKEDLESQIRITPEELALAEKKLGTSATLRTSAKTGSKVNQSFELITNEILKHRRQLKGE